MSALQKVYPDTTVPSAYLDDRTPERQKVTQEFWNERLVSYEPVISALVMAEIRGTPNPVKRKNLETLVAPFLVLNVTTEAEELAGHYVKHGIVPEKYRDDALHVAVAVISQVPVLASWNFRHLVKLSIRHQINLLNALRGYGQIEIVSPPEL